MRTTAIISGLDIRLALEWYAVISALLMTAIVVTALAALRRPALAQRINNLLDRLGGAGKPQPQETAQEPTKDNTEEDNEEADNLKNGITMLTLGIRDTYNCRLSSLERGKHTQGTKWFAENEFIGTIEAGSVFNARRAGRTKVFCAREGDAFAAAAVAMYGKGDVEHVRKVEAFRRRHADTIKTARDRHAAQARSMSKDAGKKHDVKFPSGRG